MIPATAFMIAPSHHLIQKFPVFIHIERKTELVPASGLLTQNERGSLGKKKKLPFLLVSAKGTGCKSTGSLCALKNSRFFVKRIEHRK